MKVCLFCGLTFVPHIRARRTRLYCSTLCRRQQDLKVRKSRKIERKNLCIVCKKMFDGHFNVRYCSKFCKRQSQKQSRLKRKTQSLCVICSAPCMGSCGYIRKYCSKTCKHKGMFGGKPPLEERTRKAQRNFRERNVPGLTRHEINTLRLQWISQNQGCSYCGKLCETVDHIVPLNRGGDNQRDNLTPACRSCNSSKGDRLLSEWEAHDRRKAKKTDRTQTLVG